MNLKIQLPDILMSFAFLVFCMVWCSYVPVSAHRNRSKQRPYVGDFGGEGPELLIPSDEAGEGAAETN